MAKNFFLLGLLTWVTFAFAKEPIAHDSMADAESYKVEKAVNDQEATRSVAGGKIKKKKGPELEAAPKSEATEMDSEVRYWQYSE